MNLQRILDCFKNRDALTRQRRGQEIYRRGLERLWQGRCAVTNVAVPELLRASHAKAWEDCSTGSERLNPYNGFLLNVALDALFDKYLISFDDHGGILIANKLSCDELLSVGVTPEMRLRFIRQEHLPFLRWHRQRFLQH